MRWLRKGVVPPRGYHFPVEKGTVLQGNDFGHLLKLIIRWRIANHKAPGNPEKEVLDYFEREYPYALEYDQNPEIDSTDGAAMVGKDEQRLAKYVGDAYVRMEQAYNIVDSDEAEARFGICSRCPYRKPMPGTCAVCIGSLKKQIQVMTRGKTLKNDGKAGWCSKMGAPISLIAFLSKHDIPISDKLKSLFWISCWLK